MVLCLITVYVLLASNMIISIVCSLVTVLFNFTRGQTAQSSFNVVLRIHYLFFLLLRIEMLLFSIGMTNPILSLLLHILLRKPLRLSFYDSILHGLEYILEILSQYVLILSLSLLICCSL